jgi:hypothetical protein
MRPRLTYANVVATLALVVALGTGGAWAAAKISGSLLQDRSVTGKKLKKSTVTGKEVTESSLKGVTKGGGSVQSGHASANGTQPPGPGGVVKTITAPVGTFTLECTATSAIARYTNTTPGGADVFRSIQKPDGAVAPSTVDYDFVSSGDDVGYPATNGDTPVFLDMRAGKGRRSMILRVGERRSGSDCAWDWELVTSG